MASIVITAGVIVLQSSLPSGQASGKQITSQVKCVSHDQAQVKLAKEAGDAQ